MLLNLKENKKLTEEYSFKKITAILLSILLVLLLGTSFYFGFQGKQMSDVAEKIGTAESLGKTLFTTYSFHVLAAGMLLLAAIVGAVMLAKKEI